MPKITHELCCVKSDFEEKQILADIVCSQKQLLQDEEAIKSRLEEILDKVTLHYQLTDDGFTCQNANAKIVQEIDDLVLNSKSLAYHIWRGMTLIPRGILHLSFEVIKGVVSGVLTELKIPAHFLIILKNSLLRLLYTIGIRGDTYEYIRALLDSIFDGIPDFLGALVATFTSDKSSSIKKILTSIGELLIDIIRSRKGTIATWISDNINHIISILPIDNHTKIHLYTFLNDNKEVVSNYINFACEDPEQFIELIIDSALLDNEAWLRRTIENDYNGNIKVALQELTYNTISYFNVNDQIKRIIVDYANHYSNDIAEELYQLYDALKSTSITPKQFATHLGSIIFGGLKQIILYINDNYKDLGLNSPITFKDFIYLLQRSNRINPNQSNTILGSQQYVYAMYQRISEAIKSGIKIDENTLAGLHNSVINKLENIFTWAIDGAYELSQSQWAYQGLQDAEIEKNKSKSWWQRFVNNIHQVEHSILNFLPCWLKKWIWRGLRLLNSIVKFIAENFGELIGSILLPLLLATALILGIALPLLLLTALAISALVALTALAISFLLGLLAGTILGTIIGGIIGSILGFLAGNVVGAIEGLVIGAILGFIPGLILGSILGFAVGLGLGLLIGSILATIVSALVAFSLFSLVLVGAVFATLAGGVIGFVTGALAGLLLMYLWHFIIGNLARFFIHFLMYFVDLAIVIITVTIFAFLFNLVWLPFSIFLLNGGLGAPIGAIPIIGPILLIISNDVGTALSAIGGWIAALVGVSLGLIPVAILYYIIDLVLSIVGL